MEKFEAAKTVASMEAPSTTMSFAAAPAVETTTGTPEKLRLNFYVPHDAPHDGEEVRSSRRESSNRIAGSRARSGVHRATRAFASSRTTRTTRTNARCVRTNAGLCTHRLVSHRIASHRIACDVMWHGMLLRVRILHPVYSHSRTLLSSAQLGEAKARLYNNK